MNTTLQTTWRRLAFATTLGILLSIAYSVRAGTLAAQVTVTGKKEEQKTYMTYSGWKGGERYHTVAEMRARHPEKIIEHAVKGMLPKNRLGRQMLTKLKIYRGGEHPHTAQKPQPMTIS